MPRVTLLTPERAVMGTWISLTLLCHCPEGTEKMSWFILKWQMQLHSLLWSQTLSWTLIHPIMVWTCNSENGLVMLWNKVLLILHIPSCWLTGSLCVPQSPGDLCWQRLYHLIKSVSQYNASEFTTAREERMENYNMALKYYCPKVTEIYPHFVGLSKSGGHT